MRPLKCNKPIINALPCAISPMLSLAGTLISKKTVGFDCSGYLKGNSGAIRFLIGDTRPQKTAFQTCQKLRFQANNAGHLQAAVFKRRFYLNLPAQGPVHLNARCCQGGDLQFFTLPADISLNLLETESC